MTISSSNSLFQGSGTPILSTSSDSPASRIPLVPSSVHITSNAAPKKNLSVRITSRDNSGRRGSDEPSTPPAGETNGDALNYEPGTPPTPEDNCSRASSSSLTRSHAIAHSLLHIG